jgi:hypothetical protein
VGKLAGETRLGALVHGVSVSLDKKKIKSQQGHQQQRKSADS